MKTRNEQLIPLREASRWLPGRPHRATVWRWASQGVWRDGRRVRLRTVVCGGRRYTTPGALDAFVSACTADPSPVVPMDPSNRQLQTAADLASRGI